MATSRMTCLTGGLTPCGAATGIPGRSATSSSPTCRARAVLTKASPGTPWSTARPMAAAQPGTAHATTRPTRRPPTPLGSQAGSHRHPTQGDSEPTEAFDITAITSHPATAADTSRLAGSRSHRGGQGFKSPQLHRVLAVQGPDRYLWRRLAFRYVRFREPNVRFWERTGATPASARGYRCVPGASLLSPAVLTSQIRNRPVAPAGQCPRAAAGVCFGAIPVELILPA